MSVVQLEVKFDIINNSQKTIQVDTLALSAGSWEGPSKKIPPNETAQFKAQGDGVTGDVIGQPGMKLSVLGSSGKVEYDFTCTNKTPPPPSITASGFIDGLVVKAPAYNFDNKTLNASVRID